MGWPGSVQDTRVFRSSALWIERGKYFADDEFILADKGKLSVFRQRKEFKFKRSLEVLMNDASKAWKEYNMVYTK